MFVEASAQLSRDYCETINPNFPDTEHEYAWITLMRAATASVVKGVSVL